MDRAIYIAMTGAKQNVLGQAAHSNNLANASTTGFRSDFNQSRAMPVFGDYFPTRAFALTERPASDQTMGPASGNRSPAGHCHRRGWLVCRSGAGWAGGLYPCR